MSRIPRILTRANDKRQSVLSLNLTQKIILTLLVATLATVPLWLGLGRVHSAPAPAVLLTTVAPTAGPTPSVTLDVPDEVLIGEEFKFKVTFNPGTALGYGPFIDLVLPAGGVDYNDSNGPCDGVTFVSGSAQMIGVNGGPIPLTTDVVQAACTHTTAGACETLNHPYAANGISSVPFPKILVPEGAQLVTIKLPFGSFQNNQPPIVIQVTAKVSDHADVNGLLNIYARAGFQFGSLNANNDPISDPPATLLSPGGVSDCTTWTAFAPVTPVLFTFRVEDRLSANPGPCFDGVDNGQDGQTDSEDPDCKNGKAYNGPENETATGPNYPHIYKIILNIADGRTVTNLNVQDCLPNNMVLTSVVSTSPPSSPAPPPPLGPANPPNNCITFNYPTITGGPGVKDIVIELEFYIPEKDANQALILKPNCLPVQSVNDVKAEGDWVPVDVRDGASAHALSDASLQDHVLDDKCIAIQKSVSLATDLNAPGLTPGDTLRYELNFQLTDYKTFGYLAVVDFLSDGQQIILGGPTAPKLTVKDQFASTTGTFVFNSDLFGAPAPPKPSCAGTAKLTSLTFQVSSKMNHVSPSDPRHAAGILTGGYATTPGSSTPATGQIVFYAKVLDQFSSSYSTGDQYVDKEDPMNNCVTMTGRVFTNLNPPTPLPTPTTVIAQDDSKTATAIVGDTLTKSVYAVKRSNNVGVFVPVCGPSGPACSNFPNPPQEVRPGDQVTFRIEKTIPSSDAEQLTIEDWLPLPVFAVNDPAANGTPPSWPASVLATCPPIPSPGQACRLMPGHTLAIPTLTPNLGTNSITFNYGTFNNTANTPRKADILFTVTVTNKPFADGLFMTNEAQECEYNTFGVQFCQAAIAQVNLREPNLRVRKGVIATSNPNGQFSQPGPPPTANLATAQAPPNATLSLAGISASGSAPMVSSNDLATGVLNSDLPGGVDANDIVTFAITIENQGGAPAYDAKLEERLPNCLTNLSNIVVKRGTGAVVNPLLYTLGPATSGPGFTITSIPGAPINAHHPTNGANIIVITFQAQLKANVSPGCCDNVAEIQQYASKPGGLNFVTAGFTPPFQDPAQVCVQPKLTKSLVTTSEAHTLLSDVTIGEIVRYRLVVQLPETGLLTNFQVTDALPAGLKFRNDSSSRIAFISNGPGIFHPAFGPPLGPPFNVFGNQFTLPGLTLNASQTIPIGIVVGPSCGDDPVFNLGPIKNNNSDSDLEYIVIEFNALVCNDAGNQNSTPPLPNTFSVSVGGNQIATSNSINVNVVEPNLTMTKTVAPNPAVKGQTLTYTVQYTNNGTADAFDVVLQDTLPSGLTLGTITASCPFTNVPSNTLTVTCAQIPKAPNPGSTVIVTYQAVANPASCPVKLSNRANLTWTSLPGFQGTTVNPTGSSTPGNSGAIDGERNGVTPLLTLNDYATTFSAAVKIDCPCEAMITGMKFNDLNGNGVRDLGEPGLANWTIQVTDANGITHTTTTDSAGNYSFTGPAPATYTVAEVLQSGWTQTAPTTGAYSVTVSPGQVITNFNFGNVKKQGCDLQITKEVKPSPLVSGQQATAIITVKNVGAGPCHGPTQVAESMPAGLTLVSATVPGGSCVLSTGVCNYAPAIPSGGSVVFTYVFNVTAQPGAILENCAKLKNSEDQNSANNSTCVSLTVSGDKLPDLTIKKEVQCTPGPASYICKIGFTITNNGPGAFSGFLAVQDVVTTSSPFFLDPASSNPPGWNCTISAPGTISCNGTSSVILAPSGSTSFTFDLLFYSPDFKNCGSVKSYTQPPFAGSTLIQENDFSNNESCVSLGKSASGDCVTPPANMVSWWPGDGNANDIVDGNQGASVNGATYATGIVGQAFSFAGPGDYLKVPDSTNLDITGQITMDAWIKTSGTSDYSGIVGKILPDEPRSGYLMAVTPDSKVRCDIIKARPTQGTVVSTTLVGNGNWHHVACTYDGAVVKLYVNGSLEGSVAYTDGIGVTNEALLIGRDPHYAPTRDFRGLIDEVEIFNRSLSQSEIQSIFTARSAGKCKSGSLTLTKTVENLSPSPIPAGTSFPITVSCLPSGPNLTLNLAAAGTQTVNKIPVGSKCTVTEGPLPHVSSPACPSLQWSAPAYSPGQSVTIQNSGASQTIAIKNQLACMPGRPIGTYTFTRGMNEFCIWGGGGPGSFNSPNLIGNTDLLPGVILPGQVGNTSGVRFGAIGLCYGRILSANDKVAFKYTFNAIPAAVLSYSDVNRDLGRPVPGLETRRNVFGGGLSPVGVQLYFRPQSRIKPFVSTSGGFIFFKDQVPRLNGARFNFTYDFGGGVHVFRDSRRAFTFGYKYQRISNGGRALNNPGFGGNVFSFGYSISKKQKESSRTP